ncbi:MULTISPECIES: ethanolamine ammonia-lyase subunit EutB [Aneurinibacillus]|uniref:Ethanolamine ammonia-lyase large subunit n=1 Tax=Aneurinibacillus thermoaerophilus TaxID=143495 RepID=A0A1G7X699_ANETH|nr:MULTISPECIES: ethanolamine ammonia-lyase subunit EutB [Aneurinibacillus]AMA73220.1 ethanolamine ammonia-lyase [Aneurinibacillus sp. XH2]MED0674354.1 ethanolamine ammonia-lyase subunit EutB [Aneurinibacillus thermoaerophilus]MED0678372.1 ethanolamine ammonia-lyase subunit EutB [Aneurinibacillus thermoaerophilus]MED0736103.1 ethanolamine ammonia-lyase subunit EutB [Aneurinibacillus thermoaerophilus]MED0756947.1 ethanolamine ammonia-lyase subunit EutB [Aneurinibacillus thermoaerophilus]
MKLSCVIKNTSYSFSSVKEVLAKASEEKSGDKMAKIAAESSLERMAAKVVLSEMRLADIYENPVIPYEKDEVTRVIYDGINLSIYNEIKDWSVGELRDYILSHRTGAHELQRLGRGLTSEMIAAVAKLMSSIDLVMASQKIRPTAHCNTLIGEEGRLAFRCQPNHPTDSPEGILFSIKEGLSYGSGDAVIGINPNVDTVESVSRLLHMSHDFIMKWEIPTQNCVLAHITTQMKALEKGAPIALMFQSLAGTQKANEAFGVDKKLLDEGLAMMRRLGTAAGPNVMYFETGQGSEVSLDAAHGVDMQTLEARTYGYARNWQPFMVNNVSGFIGPETLYDGRQMIRADLEDLFMGKLHGLPMGIAPTYTNHMYADQNDQEIAGMLTALAGANFYMGVPAGDDVMLNYQDTSYHDDASLREMLGLRPLREFEKWLEKMGIMENGRLTERAGDLSIFD